MNISCGVPPNEVNTWTLDTINAFSEATNFIFSSKEVTEVNNMTLDTIYTLLSKEVAQENIGYSIQVVFDLPNKWENKKILKVYFREEHNNKLKKKTLDIANIWSKYANVKFVLSDDIFDSDIRVAFKEGGGYYSKIGKIAAKSEYIGMTTMWLQDLDKKSDTKFKRTVLHEFGHAIGLLHELRNPNNDIVWDTIEVYKHFKDIYDWDTIKVNKNVFKPVDSAKYTEFDPLSIMIYEIPKNLTKNKKGIPWPNSLSEIDTITIAIHYPF